MADLIRSVSSYLAAGRRSSSTRAVYLSCFSAFEGWASSQGLAALPALDSTILLYLTDLARRQRKKLATIRVHAFAIAHVHKAAGCGNPLTDSVYQLLAGIARVHGEQAEPKMALTVADLERMLAAMGSDPHAVRDRALLLVGFASALRRSDLVALLLADARFVPLPNTPYAAQLSHQEGLVLRVGIHRREKQSQDGRARDVAIFPAERGPQLCPVRSLRAWLAVRGDAPGPLFIQLPPENRRRPQPLAPRTIADIVQRRAANIGLDPRRYGGHSLRAGMVTAAAAAGAPDHVIMRQTDHHSHAMVLRYVRTLFAANALAGVL